MTTEFDIWTGQLAKKLGRPAVPDGKIAELLGIHRNRVADFRRGHSLHKPPQPMKLDRRTRLAMTAILAGLEPWSEELKLIHDTSEDNS